MHHTFKFLNPLQINTIESVHILPPYFLPLFCLCFQLVWVSSLAYPKLLGTKMLGCCCESVHILDLMIHVPQPMITLTRAQYRDVPLIPFQKTK
jgi:hypothetical protein